MAVKPPGDPVEREGKGLPSEEEREYEKQKAEYENQHPDADRPDRYQHDPPNDPSWVSSGYSGHSPFPVPGGVDSPGKGVTTSSPAALRNFADAMDPLLRALKDAHSELQPPYVDLRAGAFGAAINMVAAYQGRASTAGAVSGLRDRTDDAVVGLIQALTAIQVAAREVAKDMATSDELNKLTADELKRNADVASMHGWIDAYKPT